MPIGDLASISDNDVFTKSRLDKWERSNRLSFTVIKLIISETLFCGIPSSDNMKNFLEAIGWKFKESDKAEAQNLLSNFPNVKYDNSGSVRNYILKLVQIASRLRRLICL